MWVTGLSDAEGSFTTTVYKSKNNNKWSVQLSFQISLNSKELNTLQKLKDFFGVGSIYIKKNQNMIMFIVIKKSDLLNVIIPAEGEGRRQAPSQGGYSLLAARAAACSFYQISIANSKKSGF